MKRRAFTLVELLVVIGIIAVLIGVLLPALQSARKQAASVKCATQLREIGNALFLYANENRGFWPVVRHEASTTFPPDPTLRSNPSRNDYWYMFLLKYFSKQQYSNVAGQRLGDFVNTPLWGCPAALKEDFQTSASSADFNSGYGMGPYGLYTPTTYVNVNGTPPGQPTGSHWAMISNSSGNLQGRYLKQVQWTQPAQRGIIADSRSWFLEIRSFGAATIPAQTGFGLQYDPNALDQFDRYRHGQRNRKQAFNVLFCDGHVSTLTDVKEGYIAFRRKFPG
jgi:prepilin-type N-terminal cleavage/methylation domain-containing protein/prepilin-type processing-associated H-X9-DG protein